MKLEIGMYVRSKRTGIRKISRINDKATVWKYLFDYIDVDGDNCIGQLCEEEILKSSNNIMDVIEKNDLILSTNGIVYQVDYIFNNYVYTYSKGSYGRIATLVDYQIKSIVTKEQFASMEYKVGAK